MEQVGAVGMERGMDIPRLDSDCPQLCGQGRERGEGRERQAQSAPGIFWGSAVRIHCCFKSLLSSLNISVSHMKKTEVLVHTLAPSGPGFKLRNLFYHACWQGLSLPSCMCLTWRGSEPTWGFPGTFRPESPERPFHLILSPRWDLHGLHSRRGKGWSL